MGDNNKVDFDETVKVEPGGIPANVDLGQAEGTPVSSRRSPLDNYLEIFRSIPEPAIVTDLDGKILDVNRNFAYTTQTKESNIIGRHISEFVREVTDGEQLNQSEDAIKRIIIKALQKDRTAYNSHTVFIDKDGKQTPYSFCVAPIKDEDGTIIGIIGLGRDSEYIRNLEDKLYKANKSIEEYKNSIDGKIGDRLTEVSQRARIFEELSITDELTKLFNRRYLFKRMSEEMQRTRRYGSPFSVVMLDIDFFKKVNDTYGHQSGDMVLYELAGILRGSVRQVDVVARTGGEEFVIILPAVREGHAFLFCERLREKVASFRFTSLPKDKSVHISLGIADYPRDDIETVDELIHLADVALYKAKITRNCTISSSNLEPEDFKNMS